MVISMVEKPKIILTLNEVQARKVIDALDLYSRLRMGQFKEIKTMFVDNGRHDLSNNDNLTDILLKLKHEIYPELGVTYHSILSNQIPDAQIAFDIQQVIRHGIAWYNEPEGGVFTRFDSPKKYSDQPLPEVRIEE